MLRGGKNHDHIGSTSTSRAPTKENIGELQSMQMPAGKDNDKWSRIFHSTDTIYCHGVLYCNGNIYMTFFWQSILTNALDILKYYIWNAVIVHLHYFNSLQWLLVHFWPPQLCHRDPPLLVALALREDDHILWQSVYPLHLLQSVSRGPSHNRVHSKQKKRCGDQRNVYCLGLASWLQIWWDPLSSPNRTILDPFPIAVVQL